MPDGVQQKELESSLVERIKGSIEAPPAEEIEIDLE